MDTGVIDRPARPGDSELIELNTSGDSKLIWNPDNADETEAARALFDTLKRKGHLAYKVVGKEGDKGEVLRDFDPHAGRIIMAPRMVGG
jgi:hypothetical protein